MIGEYYYSDSMIIEIEEYIKIAPNTFAVNPIWEDRRLTAWTLASNLKPIPISTRILKALGFTYVKPDWVRDISENATLNIYIKDDNTCIVTLTMWGVDDVTISKEMQYIHELQRFLKGLNLNLEFEKLLSI